MGVCYSCVETQAVAVVERCGKFNRMGSAGFNCIWCCIGESVAGRLSLRIQQLDVSVETKTQDDVFVRIVVSVQYQVSGNTEQEFYNGELLSDLPCVSAHRHRYPHMIHPRPPVRHA